MYIARSIEPFIQDSLFKQKVVIIYGARRTGKTTLVKNLLAQSHKKSRYINCEDFIHREALQTRNAEKLYSYIGDFELVVLDEAQSIQGIGHILKLLIDTYPHMQIIATGSSSFSLANQVGEPLVGRNRTFFLQSLSIHELRSHYDGLYVESKLEELLRFGSLPSIVGLSEQEAIIELNQISSDYLYKDILAFEGIKKSSVVYNLLKALALQLGNEVSYNELAQLIGIDHITVAKYIDILEKSHIIFVLSSLARNERGEIKKGKKIYFRDLGIRNALIKNMNSLESRTDKGALWENFCILELQKKAQRDMILYNEYFWRTHTQKEVDYIQEYDGVFHTYEYKWNEKKQPKSPKLFTNTYPQSTYSVINSKNYWEYLY